MSWRRSSNVLNRAGFAVMLCSSDEDTAKQDEQIKLLLERMVDGLIIAPAGDDEVMRRLVKSTRKPVVLIDRMIEGLEIDAVLLDNVKAVSDAVRLPHRSRPQPDWLHLRRAEHHDRPRSP